VDQVDVREPVRTPSGVFDRLTKQGALSDDDVVRTTALREVRVALLEADVSLPVARDFVKRCRTRRPARR
jgi:signal recognition particle subunit SRP54